VVMYGLGLGRCIRGCALLSFLLDGGFCGIGCVGF